MGAWKKYKVRQPVSDRQPDKDSLLPWAQKEVNPLLQQLRRVVNWIVDWLGLVQVDATDTPGTLNDKLLVDEATMTKTVSGVEGDRTITLSARVTGTTYVYPSPSPSPTPSPAPAPAPTPSPAPSPDPTVVETRLYPVVTLSEHQQGAKCILAPLERFTDVDYVYQGAHENGGDAPIFATEWTLVTPTVLRKNVAGPLGVASQDWVDGADWDAFNQSGTSTMVGKKLLAWQNTFPTRTLDDDPLQGPWVVDDVGGHWVDWGLGTQQYVTTHAQFHRATDAEVSSDFKYGKPVRVQSGAMFAGNVFMYSGAASPTMGHTALNFVDIGPYNFNHWGTDLFGLRAPAGYGRWNPSAGMSTWTSGSIAFDGAYLYPTVVGLAADGSATIPINVGDSFFIWSDTDPYGESSHFGLYELVSREASGRCTIRRVITANTAATLTGLVVPIVGVGALHEGDSFTETATVTTLDYTSTTWTQATTALDATYKLLLQSQFLSEHADQNLHSWTQAATAAGGPQLMGSPNATIVGTPKLASLPAGTYTASVRARATGGDVGASAQVTASLSIIPEGWAPGDSVPASFVSMTSPPIEADTGDVLLSFQTVTSAPTASDVTYRLALQWTCSTTSATPQTVQLTWFDQSLSTWVEVPFAMAVDGMNDGDHQHLTRRYQDVASTDPGLADPCHPWDALGPLGRVHMGIPDATLTGTGTTRRIAMPANASQAKVTPTTSEAVYGIDPTGFLEGDPVKVVIYATPTNTVTLVHLDTTSSQMFLDGVTKNITCSKTTILKFMRLDDLWRRE
jgi:hypothetical protein